MGFSLEQFFEELIEAIERPGNARKKIAELDAMVKEARQYAAECGYVPQHKGEQS